MSRADAFSAFYRESRSRLLLQVYAYCGDPEVAQRALADAYVSAGHHWRKIANRQDKDGWLREVAFRASRRSLNRARTPWYVRALHTADEHRPLLAALQSLPSSDRHLLVLHHLARLDLPAAARETGITDDAARHSLASTTLILADHGLEVTDDAIRAALRDLRRDLTDEPVERASRLRREGNRRRRSHMGLVALCSLALVIGAGALTAAQPENVAARGPGATGPTRSGPAALPAPADQIDAAVLAPLSTVQQMKFSNPWKMRETSTDFGTAASYDECLPTVPVDKKAAHFYVRTFTSGAGAQPAVATEALEVSTSIQAADSTYERLVNSFSACRADNHEISGYSMVQGVGDASALITLKYVDKRGVHTQLISISQSGVATTVWVVDTPNARPASPHELVRLAASSVQSLCSMSMGGCSRRPFTIVPQVPPRIDQARGFLTAIDLPVFEGLTEPWMATSPSTVRNNPAATQCDRADFTGAKATKIAARSFVVPSSQTLATIFGMTETRGTFRSVGAANAFIAKVSKNVSTCHDRQLSLDVTASRTVHLEPGVGKVWTITLAASKKRDLTFRMGLFRVGTTVAQVTFTPTDRFDLDPNDFDALVRRAALRVTQS
ncbi:MAG: hypothetical protein WAK18_12785 [Nocardioidaceae bacterium]